MEKRYCQENITVIFPDDWDFCLLFSAFLYVSMFKPEDHIPCMAYKGTVVADGQQCPVVALQQMFQALHGIHIHVVGGFVHYHEVAARYQNLGQGGLDLFSS